MKAQSARSLLALGWIVAFAGAALAGPSGSGTPTPTATATATPTATGSVVPTATPTASATATPTATGSVIPTATPTATATATPTPTVVVPTATPTATATPTPTAEPTATATATPTPTATPPPGDLSGEYAFVSRDVDFDKNETLLNIDTVGDEFCLAGRAVGIDPTTTFNRRVVFTYQSLGTVEKSTDKAVSGEFVTVDLTLTIDELNPDGDINEFGQTITADCKLQGALKKEGDAARATLSCDIGPNLSAFDELDPETDQNLIENVFDAFPARKNIKVNVKKGKLRVTHHGVTAPEGLTVPLTCDLGVPG